MSEHDRVLDLCLLVLTLALPIYRLPIVFNEIPPGLGTERFLYFVTKTKLTRKEKRIIDLITN